MNTDDVMKQIRSTMAQMFIRDFGGDKDKADRMIDAMMDMEKRGGMTYKDYRAAIAAYKTQL